MLDILYYTAMLIGIGWLAVWSTLPEDSRLRARFWWPFEMAEPKQDPAQGLAQGPAQGPAAKARDRPRTALPGARPPARTPTGWRDRSPAPQHPPRGNGPRPAPRPPGRGWRDKR